MPYCKNCGTQISDDAKFCTKCGTQQSAFIPTVQPSPKPFAPVPSRPIFSGENEKVLFYKKYSNRAFSKTFFFIIFDVFITFFFCGIINICISNLEDKCDEYSRNSEEYETIQGAISGIEGSRTFLIFLTIISSVIILIRCFQITKNYLCITDKCVRGDASPTFGIGIVSFNLDFKLIHSATIKGERLIITSKGSQTKYHCFIDDPDSARRIINDMLYGK